MTQDQVRQFKSWLGRQSYQVRLARFGIDRIREIARENGKLGGRPMKPWSQLSDAGRRARLRRDKGSAKGGK